jgi:hypothetical protein
MASTICRTFRAAFSCSIPHLHSSAFLYINKTCPPFLNLCVHHIYSQFKSPALTKKHRDSADLRAARRNAAISLEEALIQIRPGQFLEITRVSERAPLAQVAHKYVGDMDTFRKKVKVALVDVARILKPGQRIIVQITNK